MAGSKDDALRKRGFTKEMLPSGNGCATLEVAFSKRFFCSVLREQMSLCLSGTFFCRSQAGLPRVAHQFAKEWAQKLQKKVRGRLMKSWNCDVVWNESSKSIPKIFSELAQLFLDKTATSVKCSSLAAYPVHAVRLSVTVKQRRCLADHGYTLIEFLLEESGGVEEKGEKCEPEEILSVYGLTSAEVVSLESSVPHTFSRKEKRARTGLLTRAVRYILEPLLQYCAVGLHMSLQSGET